MSTALTTAEVAAAVGVSKKTLLRWLYAGKIAEPKSVVIGAVENRVWSSADLQRARKYKEEHYRKRS